MNATESEAMCSFCHIYAAQQWHDDSYIVGDKRGLLHIKRAIEKALEENQHHETCILHHNDGETYELHVLKVDDIDTQNKLVLPYRDSWAVGDTDNTIHPFQLIWNPKYKHE